MSFRFPGWVAFAQESVHARVTSLLEDALNKEDNKLPPILVDRITVKDLSLGSTPPQLEILELGDIAQDRFRGIFKLSYVGDASISLSTRVEANPLNVYSHLVPSFTCPGFGQANKSLTIPLILTLSQVRLNGIVIVVFSKDKGLTLVFRNDPLESIRVSSTFDSITPIARFLQVQIEAKLRALFQDELPVIIHKLSQTWSSSQDDLSSALYHQYKNHNDQKSEKQSPTSSPKLRPLGLAEINPDVPAFSLNNRQKLANLIDNHQTLSLITTKIENATCRSSIGGATSISTTSLPTTSSGLFRSRQLKRRVIKLNYNAINKTQPQKLDNDEKQSAADNMYAPVAQAAHEKLMSFIQDNTPSNNNNTPPSPPPAYNE